MGKLKNDWKEMMEYFSWKKLIVGLFASVAAAAFMAAPVLVATTDNIWYLMLWIVTVVCGGIVSGICG